MFENFSTKNKQNNFIPIKEQKKCLYRKLDLRLLYCDDVDERCFDSSRIFPRLPSK